MGKYYKKLNNYQKRKRGFTLVETLVSISIFTMSLLAVLSVLAQGISNTNYAKTKIVASYLAQEGIEYMRNMRDTFVLYDGTSAANGWTKFNSKVVPSPNTLCASSNGCYFDDQNLDYNNTSQPMAAITLAACTGTNGACPQLLYDSSSGKYGYNVSGTASLYNRKIKIVQVSADETKIISTVYWAQGSGSYNVVFSESLFNWIE